MPTTTPAAVNQNVLRLCEKLGINATPVFVTVQRGADANLEDCFRNVLRKVERDGGAIIHGWQLWEWANVMLEAEFHAVWRSPTGELVDITPKADGEEAILFLQDRVRTWTGNYVDNVRMPLGKNPLCADLDFVCRRLVNLYNRSEKDGDGVSIETAALAPLQEMKFVISTLLNENGKLDSPCPCGSGMQYRKCHRRVIHP